MSFLKKLKEKISKQTDTVTEKFKQGLEKTRNSFADKVNDLVYRYRKIDEDFFEELEEILISADVGVSTVMELIDQLKEEVQRRNIQDPKEVQAVISEKLVGIYKGDSDFSNEVNIQEDAINSYFICWSEWCGENDDDWKTCT